MYKFNVFSTGKIVAKPLVVTAVVVLVTADTRNELREVPFDMDATAVAYIGSGSSTGPSMMYQTEIRETRLYGEAAQTRSETT